jgi:hypothetical protein
MLGKKVSSQYIHIGPGGESNDLGTQMFVLIGLGMGTGDSYIQNVRVHCRIAIYKALSIGRQRGEDFLRQSLSISPVGANKLQRWVRVVVNTQGTICRKNTNLCHVVYV